MAAEIGSGKVFQQIRELVRANEFDRALDYCERLLQVWPEEEKHQLLGRIAYVYDQMGRREDAFEAVSRALALCPKSLSYLDHRMILSIDVGNFVQACDDASQLEKLEEEAGTEIFRDSVRVYRAYALIKLGRTDKAISDLSSISDPGPFRIAGKNWSKVDLLNLADSVKTGRAVP